jgi:hypothetical protein
MITIDFSTALLLYLFAGVGVVVISWGRYEWEQARRAKTGRAAARPTEEQQYGHVDRA